MKLSQVHANPGAYVFWNELLEDELKSGDEVDGKAVA